jgi:uncharacterized protein (TIGR03435 family)
LTIRISSGGIPRTDPPPDQIEVHSSSVLSDPGLSIFTAVQSQLGLKLESGKDRLPMLIVDRVQKVPSPN